MSPTLQRQTADKLVAAFNDMDIPTVMSLRSPTCTRHLLPKSMNMPPQDNATYEKSLRSLTTVFRNFHLEVHDVIEDVAARKVVMWLSARGDTAAGEYVNEYMWVLEFDGDGDGEKIVASKEFVDAVMQRDFWPKLQESMRMARSG
jgi:ketosteroid isomerase-like protein